MRLDTKKHSPLQHPQDIKPCLVSLYLLSGHERLQLMRNSLVIDIIIVSEALVYEAVLVLFIAIVIYLRRNRGLAYHI